MQIRVELKVRVWGVNGYSGGENKCEVGSKGELGAESEVEDEIDDAREGKVMRESDAETEGDSASYIEEVLEGTGVEEGVGEVILRMKLKLSIRGKEHGGFIFKKCHLFCLN